MYLNELDSASQYIDPAVEAFAELIKAIEYSFNEFGDLLGHLDELATEVAKNAHEIKAEYGIVDHIEAHSTEIRAPTIVRRLIPP